MKPEKETREMKKRLRHSGMVEHTGPSRIIFNVLNYTFMIVFGFICVVPIWHVLMASISDPQLLMSSSGVLLKPLGKVTMDGYKLVMKNQNILTGYRNTLIYVLITTVIMALGTLIAGYLVSRKYLKLAKPLTLFIMFTMMFSGGMIPSYMVINKLHMLNTIWAAILPGCLNAFYIMMMKSAFEGLPESYEESAKLDGAGPITILFKILVPLVKANIAVVVMFNVITQWNSWFNASIYMPQTRNLWPLQLFMREILINNDSSKIVTAADAAKASSYTGNLVKYCVTIVGTLPLLVAYPFAQKYFVAGVQMGGVKG